MRRVGFYLVDGFAMMSTAAAMEPLRAANLFSDSPAYDIVPLSRDGGSAVSTLPGGFVTEKIGADDAFDIVFVVAGGDPFAVNDPALAAWLRRLDRAGVALGGISGGAVILAMAGLLRNRRFTLHWHHIDALRRAAPDLLPERRLFVIDRDRFTCAGGTAPLDMMQALISADHGTAFARRIADWFIQTEVREASAPQRASIEARYGSLPAAVSEALGLMETHVADPLSLEQLAGLVGLSSRQLQRQFNAAQRGAVMKAYQDIRLSLARELIQTTHQSIADIAQMTGFSAVSSFSAAFRRKYARTPSELRRSRRPA